MFGLFKKDPPSGENPAISALEKDLEIQQGCFEYTVKEQSERLNKISALKQAIEALKNRESA